MKEKLLINLNIISGICNKSCGHCIVPHFEDKKLMGTGDLQDFLRLQDLDKIQISIVPMGEPLMHPQFFEILEILIESGVELAYIATNLGTRILKTNELRLLTHFNRVDVDMSEVNQDPHTLWLSKRNARQLDRRAYHEYKPCAVRQKRIYNPNSNNSVEGVRTLPYIKHNYRQVFAEILPNATNTETIETMNNYQEAIGFEYDSEDPMMREAYDHKIMAFEKCIPMQLNMSPLGEISSCMSVVGEVREGKNISLGNAYKDNIFDILKSDKAMMRLYLQSKCALITNACSYCTYPQRQLNDDKYLQGFPQEVKDVFSDIFKQK